MLPYDGPKGKNKADKVSTKKKHLEEQVTISGFLPEIGNENQARA